MKCARCNFSHYPLPVVCISSKVCLKVIERIALLHLVGVGKTNGQQRVLSSASLSWEAGNVTLGESQIRFKAAFPTPRVDRGAVVDKEC